MFYIYEIIIKKTKGMCRRRICDNIVFFCYSIFIVYIYINLGNINCIFVLLNCLKQQDKKYNVNRKFQVEKDHGHDSI